MTARGKPRPADSRAIRRPHAANETEAQRTRRKHRENSSKRLLRGVVRTFTRSDGPLFLGASRLELCSVRFICVLCVSVLAASVLRFYVTAVLVVVKFGVDVTRD